MCSIVLCVSCVSQWRAVLVLGALNRVEEDERTRVVNCLKGARATKLRRAFYFHRTDLTGWVCSEEAHRHLRLAVGLSTTRTGLLASVLSARLTVQRVLLGSNIGLFRGLLVAVFRVEVNGFRLYLQDALRGVLRGLTLLRRVLCAYRRCLTIR